MIKALSNSRSLSNNQTGLVMTQKAVVTLLLLVIALLPFGRLSELPVIVLALWGFGLLCTQFKKLSALSTFKPFTCAFIGYFAIILISGFDSYWPEKTNLIAAASWRFYLTALVVIYYSSPQLLQQVLKWLSVLMVIWSIDALIQSVFGQNLMGQTSYPGRLTGVFGQNVKLGPVLALMLPLVMVYMCQYRAFWRWFIVGLIITVILLSGTRSAWLMMGFVLIIFWWHHVKGRRWLLLLKATSLSLLAVVILWFASSDFQQRVERSMTVMQGNEQALDFALADRLPIWNTALSMYVDHPYNGVGARAFRKAYSEYAAPDDVWVAQKGGGLHAHHWVLELLAETGTIGLFLMALLLVIIIRCVNKAFSNELVWPFAVALMAALLPVISLYSLFSSFWSICLWWLLILMFAGVQSNE